MLTQDELLGGRVRLTQPAEGYRVNADTVLLAAAVDAPPGAELLEAGCGVGGALLCVAARLTGVRLTGVERDPISARLAVENAAASPWTAAIFIREGDVLQAPPELGTFDGAFFNPPYDPPGRGRAPAPVKRAAFVEEAPLDAWVAALSNRLRGGGRLTLIHRAARLAEILAALEGRLGGVEILPVRPRAGAPAKRVIVRAHKGSRAPLALHGGLDLHGADGAFTAQAHAIFADAAPLDWR